MTIHHHRTDHLYIGHETCAMLNICCAGSSPVPSKHNTRVRARSGWFSGSGTQLRCGALLSTGFLGKYKRRDLGTKVDAADGSTSCNVFMESKVVESLKAGEDGDWTTDMLGS